MRFAVPAFLLFWASTAQAQSIIVEPFLQQLRPDSVWIVWETNRDADSVVEWGETVDFGQRVAARSHTNFGLSQVQEAQLTGLRPETTYYYRVRSGDHSSVPQAFHTPAEKGAGAATRIAVVSDMQRDGSNPNVYGQIIRDGISVYAQEQTGLALPEALSMVLVPGDLVPTGLNIGHWRNYFFADSAPLMGQVPFYPVLGNHEMNSPFYYNYFHLPENGTRGSEEEWWWFDQSNLRIIGLDSNGVGRSAEQLTWLAGVLDDACGDAQIDFVFAQLHHPHHSEGWTPGNTPWTGRVIEQLEAFSTHCGKPSVHFYGHTHAYSRGQSRDHNHTMVNAASAGGRLDRWGEHDQADYPEYSISTDDYGFVYAEVEAGDEPVFRIRRLSWGVPEAMTRNRLTDELLIRRYNEAPEQPAGRVHGEPVQGSCFTLAASEFVEADGDGHGASHWQVAADCDGFESPIVERWRQRQNHYFGEDRNAGVDLTEERVEGLEPERSYCWRVRYRDQSLGWSPWSEAIAFETGPAHGSPELLVNGDAEAGTEGWRAVEGPFESLTAGECNGVDPFEGTRYFAIGGLCSDEVAYGEARQSVEVGAFAEAIDAGQLSAELVAHLRDFNGGDEVAASMVFYGAGDEVLGSPGQLSRRQGSWQRMSQNEPVPAGTRRIDVVLSGRRNNGTDNDSYADAISLRLRPADAPECQAAPPAPEPPPVDAGPAEAGATDGGPGDTGSDDLGLTDAGHGEARPANDAGSVDAGVPAVPAEGCGCAGGAMPNLLLFLLPMALRRRRRA